MNTQIRFCKILALVTAAAISLTALAGCGTESSDSTLAEGDWSSVVAAAKEEGRVTFYSGGDAAQADAVAAAFEAQYPEIDVQIEKGAKDLFARIEAQMSSGVDGADVFLTSDEPWFTGHTGDFLPMTGPGTEGLHADAWVIEDEAAIVHRSPYSMFVWNTAMFPDGFRDWQDFVNANVRGKLAFRREMSKSAAGFMDFMVAKFGDDYLRGLGEQDVKLYPSVVPATQAVASGEVGVTMGSLPSLVAALKAAGAPVDSYIPENGYGIDFQVAALKSAHRPNAAAVFADFLLSQEGQEVLNGNSSGGAVRDGIPGSVDMSGYTMLDGEKFTREALDEWQMKIDEYF